MLTATYFGAGYDTRPLEALPEVERFIYIDRLPTCPRGVPLPFERGTFQHIDVFFTRLTKVMSNVGFYVIQSMDNCIVFLSGKRQVWYYHSVCIPYDLPAYDEVSKFRKQLQETTHLIVDGYFPSLRVLMWFTQRPIWVGFHSTCYREDLTDPESIVNVLYKAPQCMRKFVYIDQEGRKEYQEVKMFLQSSLTK